MILPRPVSVAAGGGGIPKDYRQPASATGGNCLATGGN